MITMAPHLFALIFWAVSMWEMRWLFARWCSTVNKTKEASRDTLIFTGEFILDAELLTDIISPLQPTHRWMIPYKWGASGRLPSLACVGPVAKDDARLDGSREILHHVRILHHKLTFPRSSHLDILPTSSRWYIRWLRRVVSGIRKLWIVLLLVPRARWFAE